MADWYCPLPFRHVFVDSTGLAPCCQIQRQAGDLDNWHNNKNLIRIQEQTLKGLVPTECQICVDQETAQGTSLRTSSLEDYSHQRFETVDIDFVDYRSSNICNFRCRSCEPQFSHGINNDYLYNSELTNFGQPVRTKTIGVDETNQDWIVRNLSKLHRLMFTGGEPTVIPEVVTILEHVIKQDLPNLNILITTNGSFSDDFWYKLVQRHPRIHWTVSVDAVGPAAEIVRHGTEWSRIDYNLQWLSKHAVSMDINTVISNLNLFQLGPLLKLVRKLQLQSQESGQMGSEGIRHQFYTCRKPSHHAADNWPDDLRSKSISYLQHCLALDLDSTQQNAIESLMNLILFGKFDETLWTRTQKYNQILDKMRDQNHLVLYQEI